MAQVRDVVCGMTVDSETAQHKSEYRGQTYYFCSGDCKRTFDQDPEKYLSEEANSRQSRSQR
jgi:Cu+-exporting ATPase